MKRTNAFLKLAILCRRLDLAASDTFPIVTWGLYLFGSLLTDKPTLNDIDLCCISPIRILMHCMTAWLIIFPC